MNQQKIKVCAISVDQESEVDVVDDCAMPNYNAKPNVELAVCTLTGFESLLEQYRTLFCPKPEYNEDAWHYIPISGNPVKVSPTVPSNYNLTFTRVSLLVTTCTNLK